MKYQLRTTDELMSDIATLIDFSQMQPAELLAPLVAIAVSYVFFYEGLIHKLGNNNKFWSTVRRVLPFVDDAARDHGFYASYGVDKIEHVGTITMQERDAVQLLYGKGFIDNPIAAHKTDWADRREIASLLDVAVDDVAILPAGSGRAVLLADDRLGTWESPAALDIDLAAMALLSDRGDIWDRLDVKSRSEVVAALRLFVEICPDCGGGISLGEVTVESCRSSRGVVAATCEDCGVRMLELNLSADELAGAAE